MTPTFETSLFPVSSDHGSLTKIGFRFGAVGTHTSRTLMFNELVSLLHNSAAMTRDDFRRLVVEENCLGKSTTATRKSSFQRLSELYGFNQDIPLFRLLRRLWELDIQSQPLLALLTALARDPLLRNSSGPVVSLPPGAEFVRSDVAKALRIATEGRLNDSILDKVVRNCASTWSQAGFLEGRTFKKRTVVKPTYASVTLALAVAHLAGFRGTSLFSSGWVSVLDCDPSMAREYSLEAKRRGLIDLRISGDVVDLALERLDPLFNQQ